MKVDSPAIWGTQYCSANQSRRVEWLCHGTNRGCEGVDSHMQFLLVRAANSSVVASLDRKRLGQTLGASGISIRGVFDEETRRKPLAFAADAVRYGI